MNNYKHALNAIKKASNIVTTKPESSKVEITKFNEEQMVSIEPLYCSPMKPDAHNQAMIEEEIRKMVDNINMNIDKISANIGHLFNTSGFHFVRAWVNECDCIIGSEFVPEGQPIIKVQFTDKTLWEMRKTGQLQGLSIGALGTIVANPDYKEV
ncbi:XkdF-like putative serine protease domain-containing protein [Aeromonas hydrophila]|uniref:XkdF-like putative serine protease domain-containing protein n=1 Tax=Aeromonas hydrophila TaxID=644 RepID=UPI003EC66F1B